MNVLVISAGSSSLKYLLDVDTHPERFYARKLRHVSEVTSSFGGHEELGGEKQKLEVALPDPELLVSMSLSILKTIDKPVALVTVLFRVVGTSRVCIVNGLGSGREVSSPSSSLC